MTPTLLSAEDEHRLSRTLRAKADQLDLSTPPVFEPSTIASVEPLIDRQRRRQAHRSQRVWLAAAVLAVVAVCSGVVVASRSTSPVRTTQPADTPATDGMAVLSQLEAIPASVAGAVVPAQPIVGPPTTLDTSTAPRTIDGKPAILYIGADYCPYCAAQRWPLVLALARFGTFSNLNLTHSSDTDVFPDTASFTFHGSSYTSPYLAFTGVETETNQPDNTPTSSGYTPLDSLTADQQHIMQAQDPTGDIPFVDLAAEYQTLGATYDIDVLTGKSADQITTALADPTTAISRAVWPQVNQLTTDFCQLTGHQPASACQGH